ncbi:hypothetical protein CHS0354_032218 [Potamilus streckersoni]|uniref:Uncharacterized protein n=1 Tax=Potamilus streckersoni TaxID=2493646 RepID=A0AAE0RMF1_9BIVA|nr:hypothetical protein CHS0354_032218 [Potamilus streckersoni]
MKLQGDYRMYVYSGGTLYGCSCREAIGCMCILEAHYMDVATGKLQIICLETDEKLQQFHANINKGFSWPTWCCSMPTSIKDFPGLHGVVPCQHQQGIFLAYMVLFHANINKGFSWPTWCCSMPTSTRDFPDLHVVVPCQHQQGIFLAYMVLFHADINKGFSWPIWCCSMPTSIKDFPGLHGAVPCQH